MADIRIKDLPLAAGGTSPTGTDFVPIDGASTRKTTITTLGDVAVPVASQAEAESGTDAVKRMTPLTVKQSISSEVGGTLASAAQGTLADSAIQSVNTKTGNSITLSKSDIGLANVDNTSDASKPVSSATQSALDQKAALSQISVSVNSRSELALLNTSQFTRAILNEYGRAGVFIFVSGNFSSQITADVNQGIYIASSSNPTGSSGSWIRQYNGNQIDIRWFGCIEDGITDCSSNINSALLVANSIYIPDTALGFRINSTINVPANRSIKGEPSRSKMIHGGSSNFISFNGNDITVEGLYVDATNNASGWTFFINSTSTRERISIRNIYAISSKGGIADANSTGLVLTLKLQDVAFRLHKGRGIYLQDAFAFVEMSNVYVDYLNNATAQNYIGFAFVNVEGITLINCEVTGSYNVISGTSSTQMGFFFQGCRAVYLFRVFADNCGGIGIDFVSCQYVRVDNSTSSLCNGQGVYVDGSTAVQITNLYVGGRVGAGGASAGVSGLFVTNGSQVVTTNATLINCTGYGYSSSGSISSSSGLKFSNNTSGQYTIGSTSDQIYASQSNSNSGINGVIGPATA